jgi:hypothetical protein
MFFWVEINRWPLRSLLDQGLAARAAECFLKFFEMVISTVM